MRNLDNLREAVESPMGYFCPKEFIPSAKIYTHDLCDITFNYLCEN